MRPDERPGHWSQNQVACSALVKIPVADSAHLRVAQENRIFVFYYSIVGEGNFSTLVNKEEIPVIESNHLMQ